MVDSGVPLLRRSTERSRGQDCAALDRPVKAYYAGDHTQAGRILEKPLESHETRPLREAEDLEESDPIEYPDDVKALLTMIEEVATREGNT